MGEPSKDRIGNVPKHQKSYFDVLGLCCSSEVPLIEKILKPLSGVQKVSVIVPSKTVIVVHDSLLISQHEILKALNQARLEATVRAYGSAEITKKWPSPYILACGVLLVVSLFKRFFHPLRWFAIAAVLVGINPIILRGIAAIRRLTLDINILLLIAALSHAKFPMFKMEVGGAVALRDYSEAAFVVFLFTIAEWLESRASHKATAGMSSLMSMAPQKAVLAETGQIVDIEDVEVNTIIAVKAGEVIPIDGIVVDGQSEVDERSLTGESLPVTKQVNSLVWAGTLNIDGYISVNTTALSENSAVAKMKRLVEEAQNSRSNTQRLIDSCTKYYTPAVVIIAAGVALVPLVMRVNNPRIWFQLALVLLVSACPCALVLSTPVATFCALLKAARIGLLIKGGDVLEALAKTRVVAFDKTGTITKGEFKVVEFQSISSKVSLEMLLYWVSSIESKSSHPMAAALVEHARSHSIEPKPDSVKEFHIYPGEGIYGEVDGRNIHIGNKRIAARVLCETVPNMEDMKEGVTYGYVFLDMVPVGTYALSDTCRIGAAEAIKELKSLGIKTAMLTGDSMEASLHAQRQLNHVVEEVHAELLPEDKVQLIGKLKSREGSTAMVGDGMNDAPALAMADVGISMGVSGSAVAMETSHITLMSNDIRKIPRAIRLARKTRRMIIMNIIFSGVTKIAILAIAFAGHPLLWAAVLADVGTCLLVILNSMTLLQTKTSPKKKCCGSSHKAHMEKPKHTEHCGCQDNHGCHDHRKGMDERRHSHCMNHDHPEESPAHAHCCQELATEPTNSTQEHLITITDARHDSGDLQKQQTGPDSNMTCENQTLECSSNNCNDKEKKRVEECCMGNRNDCGMRKGCSSSEGLIVERRELGGCCRSYTKACGSKDSCCASGSVQLPEIITE
ncbi:E1-E2 ATPase [Musa troglodytarum]|uniref:E1-E2 ATPase n=1 Tax=Musa troglodytarum TaxID=320322 RepID=A0A9E7L277_9LILI|nr:E1-E2 ATPase [Musa troglodytarum]URE37836.1 E1-E2 ATPase [Musa troglodytarum]